MVGFWEVVPFRLTGRNADLVVGVGVSSVFVFHPRPLPVADREPFPLLLPPRPLPLGGGPRPLPLRLSFLPCPLFPYLLRMEDFGPPGKPGGPHYTRGPTRGPTYLPGGP